eukprot:9462739-Pyramimonas_sp.AAC.1
MIAIVAVAALVPVAVVVTIVIHGNKNSIIDSNNDGYSIHDSSTCCRISTRNNSRHDSNAWKQYQ